MSFSTLVQLYFGDQFYCKRLKMTISYQYKMYYLIVAVKYHNDMVCPCLYHHSQYQIPPVYTTTHSTRSLLFIPTLIVPDPTCLYQHSQYQIPPVIPPLIVPDPSCLYHHSQYQIPPVYTTTRSTRSLLFIPPLAVPDPTCLYHHSQYQIPPV